MYERMKYTQANSTIYLQEQGERIVFPREESGGVTPEEPLRHADKGLLHREQNTKRMHL